MSINGAQSVKLEKGTIEFKHYFKQIPVPFKISADFEGVEIYEGFYTKKYQDHNSCSFAHKRLCVDDKFFGSLVVLNLLKQFLTSMNTMKK